MYAAQAQAHSKAAEVSKLQKKVAELESRLSEKEAEVKDDLRASIVDFLTSFSKILIFLAMIV